MLLSCWKEMPLALVSAEYLGACQAQINFLTVIPQIADDIVRNHNLVCDCVSPHDLVEGDGADVVSWYTDGLGMHLPPRGIPVEEDI